MCALSFGVSKSNNWKLIMYKNLFKKSFCLALALNSFTAFAGGTTSYGKIVGIETREWGLHIQTDFPFTFTGCSATVGALYMYDFRYDGVRNNQASSTIGSMETSIILAAFAAQQDISFHIYECHDTSSRPLVGYIRVKK